MSEQEAWLKGIDTNEKEKIMTLGKAFFYLEDARNYRDMLQSLTYPTDGISNSTYEMPLSDCKEIADVLDVLLDLVSTIEVVGD